MIEKWDTVPISQIARKVSRSESVDGSKVYRLLGTHWYAKGLYVKDEKSGMEIRASNLFAVKEGDFVYNRLFAWKGSFAVAQAEHEGCFVSNEFPCFELDRERLSPKFLWLYFSRESAWLEALGLSSGSTPTSRNRLKEGQFLQMQVPLPPLDEQRRIVARIEELAALIEEARELRVKAREEAEILFASALRTIFDSWQGTRVTVEELVGRENLRNGKSVRTTELSTDINCLRLSALREGRVNCTDTKPVLLTAEKASPYLVREGDVFVMRGSGTKGLVGQAGIVEECVEGTIFPDLFIRVPLDQDKVLPSFFVAWWNSPQMRNAIEDTAKTTSGIWKINQGHVASFSIPLPPLEEQQRIVAYLDSLQTQVDQLTATQDATQAELDVLLPSVLDQAFRGDL